MSTKTRRRWRKQLSLLIGLHLYTQMVSSASAQIGIEYKSFQIGSYDCQPLAGSDPQRIVQEATAYWNTLTRNKQTMTIGYGEYVDYTFLVGGISANIDGQEVIAFNKANPFSYTMPGQMVPSVFDFFSLAAHEIGHSVGIQLDRDEDRAYTGTQWSSLVRDTEGKGISGLWISSGPDPTGAESFTDKVARGVKFEFAGSAAAAVYGDTWMGGGKTAVRLPIEATYQFSDGTFHSGSSLLHPYTRFGNMNAVIVSSKRPFFNEAELAVFRDLGLTVDIEGQFGHSVYTNSNRVTNRDTFSSTNRYSVGLHIVGDNNTITQQGNLHASGQYGAGLRIEGISNKVLILAGTTISANGEAGMGVLVTHGTAAHLVNSGTIEAIGTSGIGVYLNSGTWKDDYWTVQNGRARQFDNSGVINAGTGDAIRLAGSVNDMTVNFMNGSQVTGNITAETGSKAVLSFGKKAAADGTATADTDPAAVMSMTGTITGSDGIAVEVLAGKLTQTGSSTVTKATVKPGASWIVTGDLENKGQFGIAAYGDTVGTINVSGQASVDGSKVVMVKGSIYKPEQTYDILQAGSISGTVQGGAFTGLLNATAVNDGKKATVTTVIGDNLGTRTAKQQQLHLLMKDMYSATQSSDMYKLFSLDAAGAKQALDEIGSGGPLGTATLTQSTTVAGQAIAARMTGLKNTYLLGASIDTREGQEKTVIPADIVLLDIHPDNNWWLKFGKSWNKIGNDYNSHSSSFVIGVDRKVSAHDRQGLFLAYGKNSGAGTLSQTTNKDIRFGLYAASQQGARDWHLYADYGRQDNQSSRSLPALALKADSQYHSRTIELGGTYKYDLHYNSDRTWHLSPYITAQAVRYMQDGYHETGAGVYSQQTRAMHNTYIAGQAGIEFSRLHPRGSVAVKAGYKHIFSGHDPAVVVNFAGSPGGTFTVTGSSMDRDLLVLGLAGHHKINDAWLLDGSIEVERGKTNTSIMGEITIKRKW